MVYEIVVEEKYSKTRKFIVTADSLQEAEQKVSAIPERTWDETVSQISENKDNFEIVIKEAEEIKITMDDIYEVIYNIFSKFVMDLRHLKRYDVSKESYSYFLSWAEVWKNRNEQVNKVFPFIKGYSAENVIDWQGKVRKVIEGDN